ncbi:hypothetical protein Q428_09220 [Fervidicella metallireducens AeB]|uniref:Polymerase/histidinol phosphatase N-terminal domain-containing protein n=2 Tax=Fervidicella TaxID=1403538 RepID=A0A017RUC0_9CLOT|nr:hypothetical protein Q428_09220 [Fervidicella metallireducens AeB]
MVDYDLHIHSNFSDGKLNPRQIFEVAQNIGLTGFSITDHDTVGAIDECLFLVNEYKIDFIPGLELSTDFNGLEVHLLGYFIDHKNKFLCEFLEKFKNARFTRAQEIINILKNMNYDISLEEVIVEAGNNYDSIGRPHIARLLVKKGYYKELQDVFKILLNKNRPAYVERYKINLLEAIELINLAKGVPVLAHPLGLEGMCRNSEFEQFIKTLTFKGLKGVEIFHPMHSLEDEKYLKVLAKKYGLMVTGGSDCHGNIKDNKYQIGEKGIGLKEINRLRSLVR